MNSMNFQRRIPGALTLALVLSCGRHSVPPRQLSRGRRQLPSKHRPSRPVVYVNPRSGPDDPRVGLKGGLYDAATANLGLQLVLTTPKPAGFAPDLDSIKAVDATPAPPPVDPDAPRDRGALVRPTGPRANYGGTNSDLAFDSKYLFNGNYNGDQYLRHLRPGPYDAGHVHRLPRRPGRRLRL